jgi:hypothetical protein
MVGVRVAVGVGVKVGVAVGVGVSVGVAVDVGVEVGRGVAVGVVRRRDISNNETRLGSRPPKRFSGNRFLEVPRDRMTNTKNSSVTTTRTARQPKVKFCDFVRISSPLSSSVTHRRKTEHCIDQKVSGTDFHVPSSAST